MSVLAPRQRPLMRVPVPPGPAGVGALLPHLRAALEGTGPAIAPTPVVGPTISADYVASITRAVHADDPGVPLESDDIALVMPTSGSTGNPRGVLLTADCLAPGTAAANGLSPAGVQWVLALPVTSMGGMNVVVRALATGNEPVVVPSVGGAGPFAPEEFASAVEASRVRSCDIRVSLVPPQVSRLLASDAGVEALQQCSLILVGGAATRPELLADASARGIALTTTYGSTETAGGCVFDGRAIPGASISVDSGRIRVHGQMVARGYRCDLEATQLAFSGNTFVTPDLGEFDSDGRLVVLGRLDDVVVVNGVNVSPIAVEHALAGIAGVRAAAVVAAGEHPRLVAFIEADDPAVREIAISQVRASLGQPAVPKAVLLVDRLPHLPNGKVDRSLLAARASSEIGEK